MVSGAVAAVGTLTRSSTAATASAKAAKFVIVVVVFVVARRTLSATDVINTARRSSELFCNEMKSKLFRDLTEGSQQPESVEHACGRMNDIRRQNTSNKLHFKIMASSDASGSRAVARSRARSKTYHIVA